MQVKNYTQYLNSTPLIRRLIVPCLFGLSFVVPFFMNVLGSDIAIKMQMALSCFLLILIWNHLVDTYDDRSLRLFSTAEDGQPHFISYAKKCKHKTTAILIQHSLLYAKDILRELVNSKHITDIEIYLQHPDMAITQNEAIKITASVHDFEHNRMHYEKNCNKNITLYFYKTPPNIRCCLIKESCAIVGWYIFSIPHENIKDSCGNALQIFGHNTPAIVIRNDDQEFCDISSFIEKARDGLLGQSISNKCTEGENLIQQILKDNYNYPPSKSKTAPGLDEG